MSEQLDLFGGVAPARRETTDKEKRNWENGFQRWSNKQLSDGQNSYGACGYGVMCDYCEDMTYGRPCIRALNAMIRDKRIKIDYSKQNYEEVWNGLGVIE